MFVIESLFLKMVQLNSRIGYFFYKIIINVNNIIMKMIDESDFDYAKFGYNEVEKNGIILSSLNVKEDNNCGFKKGSYKILSCPQLYLFDRQFQNVLVDEMISQLDSLLKILKVSKSKTVLICGLGNDDIIADSLGQNVCKKILATRLLKASFIKSKICTLMPNVQTITGIKTFDIVYGVAKNINASLIILIDSLLTNNVKRIGHSFQMSTCGIIPGGAIKNNKEISYETTGIKCLTIGVPFMLDLKQIGPKINKSMIVAPKDIKQMIDKCSTIIADSINILFNQNLKKQEILELMNPF